jgi:uncharacterized membrane protein
LQQSFWGDLLKRYPVVASIMLAGTLIGCIIGFVVADNMSHLQQPRVSKRTITLIVLGISVAGGFVGLIVGVLVDTIVGVFRSEKKPTRKKRRRYRGDVSEYRD